LVRNFPQTCQAKKCLALYDKNADMGKHLVLGFGGKRTLAQSIA
jgi:hypothetical protein